MKRTRKPSKTPSKAAKPAATPETLTSSPAIAKYLGQPVSVAQRWTKSGMPVQGKGRSMIAVPEELSKWLGRESGTREPVHIAQPSDEDLLSDLRSGLKEVRKKK